VSPWAIAIVADLGFCALVVLLLARRRQRTCDAQAAGLGCELSAGHKGPHVEGAAKWWFTDDPDVDEESVA
jgi:hypothetical protein